MQYAEDSQQWNDKVTSPNTICLSSLQTDMENRCGKEGVELRVSTI